MFMNLGGGDNGKSVYLAFVGNMLGKDNIEHIQIQDLENDQFMCAKLEGKIANIFPDLEPDELKTYWQKSRQLQLMRGIEGAKQIPTGIQAVPLCQDDVFM